MAFLGRNASIGRARERNKKTPMLHTSRIRDLSHGKLGLLKARGQQKEKLCRHMVDIWNQTVQGKLYVEDKAVLGAKREKRLIQFLEEVLGPERSWEDYCRLLASHHILGKVALDWALTPQNAHMVFSASPDPKARGDIPWLCFYEAMKKKHQEISYGAEWFQICQYLAKRVGQKVYQTWFEDACLIKMGEKTLTIQVGNAFKQDYIFTYFFLDVVYAVQAVYPLIHQIRIKRR